MAILKQVTPEESYKRERRQDGTQQRTPMSQEQFKGALAVHGGTLPKDEDTDALFAEIDDLFKDIKETDISNL